TRSTDFLTPKSAASQAMRDAVLELAQDHGFARPMVNSGRLSTAVSYPGGPLNTEDEDHWQGGVPPGSPVLDAPHRGGWLLTRLRGDFIVLARNWQAPAPQGLRVIEVEDLAAQRLGLEAGNAALIRPDHYVAARFKAPTAEKIASAMRRSMEAR